MKVQVQEVSPTMKQIDVDIEADKIKEEIERGYAGLARRAKIPGFRAGKVPRSVLERYYGAQVLDEVLSRLVTDTYNEAIDEQEIHAVAQPEIQSGTYEPGKDFHYTATVEVRPVIEVKEYKGLEVNRDMVAISDEMVDREIDQLRERMAQVVPVEGRETVEQGDLAVINFKGMINGEPFEGGSGQDFPLEIGSGRFIPGFEEQLVGQKVGDEKTITVTFPEDYGKEDLAGKEAQFEVTVTALKRRQIPELDDEFAKEVGDFENVEALRNKVRETLTERAEAESKAKAQNDLVEKLIEHNPVEVPNAMVERQAEAMIEDSRARLAQQGIDLKALGLDLDNMREEMKPEAEKRVKGMLLIEAVAEEEHIQADETEIESKLQQVAAGTGMPLAKIKGFYRERGRMEGLKHQIREEKTLDFLMAKAKINEVLPSENDETSTT